MKLSLVVPCFNEEENVVEFYKETTKAFRNNVEDYELIFVDDGSKDKTYELLKALYEHTDNVKVVSFSRNFGKESAIYAGLEQSEGDYTCVIDADLQQRPEVVLEMKKVLDEDSSIDCVAAFQAQRKEGALMTFCKDSFYKLMNKISDVEFYQGASDFRLMRRAMVEAVLNLKEYHRFSKGLFSFVGFNTKFIPYEVQERAAGTSKWSFSKLFIYAIEGIVGFTTAPLKIPTFAGLGLMAVSFLYLIIALIVGAATSHLTAFIAVIFLLLFLSGMNATFIGIIGEYLARAYMQGKKRPIYIAKEILKK